MKVIKIIFSILIIPYIAVAIFTTACLMNYNKYGITEFGNKSLIIVEDESLEPTFKRGNLLIVKRNSDLESVKPGDLIFFYNNYNDEVSKEVLYLYFDVIRENVKNKEIKRLEEKLVKEIDPLEQAKLADMIRKLRIGESNNG